ncbi:hypothetical protein PROFUN_07860 [Planoprotostelium fungivorum]|uniref:Uncharacterized protein n=1 Tax=Planoprotostelium fungivorum TaxID=1890364 RepID=A0A2P6NLG1_9EUKA|nr:hypothetical protein PROFUN_07860 [Planoprotostelium fungivorum]
MLTLYLYLGGRGKNGEGIYECNESNGCLSPGLHFCTVRFQGGQTHKATTNTSMNTGLSTLLVDISGIG